MFAPPRTEPQRIQVQGDLFLRPTRVDFPTVLPIAQCLYPSLACLHLVEHARLTRRPQPCLQLKLRSMSQAIDYLTCVY